MFEIKILTKCQNSCIFQTLPCCQQNADFSPTPFSEKLFHDSDFFMVAEDFFRISRILRIRLKKSYATTLKKKLPDFYCPTFFLIFP